MERDFIQKLTYDVNNGGKIELIQRGLPLYMYQ